MEAHVDLAVPEAHGHVTALREPSGTTAIATTASAKTAHHA